ncbi:ribonuclease catalytic domain-containing protein [Taylorella equigenitalis]|uniref:ribonuclease catalytic domain-containing protein n=1 Tax=Taylorella equigenitalis TaxID=29575 RepID=UPI000418BD64|nr:RNB domain-containing ribonuclease [Taylorella equigenitalis]ASY41296.1 exoribonuclease II [Taylorella equigenitalis]
MHILYEEAGKIKAGTVAKDAPATFQVTTSSGKVVKVKKQNVLLEFTDIDPTELMNGAIPEIPLKANDLWELIPAEGMEFESIIELCSDLPNPPTSYKLGVLEFLRSNPIYFQKKNKTHFIPAPKEQIEAALLANEKKKQQEALQKSYLDSLRKKEVPEGIAKDPQVFLNKNKSPFFYKALEDYLTESGKSLNNILMELGLFQNELELHKYLLSYSYPELMRPHTFGLDIKMPDTNTLSQSKLDKATVEAYSVDDDQTTEIDDAFSVMQVDEDIYKISIHIAAPALVYERDNWLHKISTKRMSTFYAPTEKYTMLPDDIVQSFSLNQGEEKPTVSLYLKANVKTGEILEHENKIELIEVKENLALNKLDNIITKEYLESSEEGKYKDLFNPLLKFAKARRKIREDYRGYPETQRDEYTFKINDELNKIEIEPRCRTSPLNFIVAELMILCNHIWADDISKSKIPAIFRGYNFGRTSQGTKPTAHALIGVDKYAWFSSPLRRFVDLVNQAQLIALIKGGMAAQLISPFKPKDAELQKLIAKFDDVYSDFSLHQNNLEKYWCLRYILQENITEVKATAIRNNIVRFNDLPFVAELSKTYTFEKGQELNLKINSVDLASLSLDANLI